MKPTTDLKLGRRLLLAGAGASALSGCFGSFAAVRSLWGWNDDFDNKWVKWLVFLGLNIIPVYWLFTLADVLVLNSLEFWTGSNPVKAGPDGSTLTRVATADPATIRVEVSRNGRLEHALLFRRVAGERIQMLDTEGNLLTEVGELPDGSVQLLSFDQRSGNSRILAQLSSKEVSQAQARVATGQSALLALNEQLGPRRAQLTTEFAALHAGHAPRSVL